MTVQGRWRIIEMPGFDRDYVDLGQPAFIDFQAGELAFGALQANFSPGPIADDAELDWEGCDEMDPISGSAWVERQPDGSIHGELNVHNGDDFPFIARPWTPSSTAC